MEQMKTEQHRSTTQKTRSTPASGRRALPRHRCPVGDEQGVGRRETRERKQEGTRCAGICGGLCLGVVSVKEDYVGVGD
jgi:hypothetical protein